MKNSLMSNFAAKRGGSSEDRAQLHSILLAVNSKLIDHAKKFVGVERTYSGSEMQYLMKIWTSDVKTFKKTNESLKTFLFEELTNQLEQKQMSGEFLQLPLVHTGKKHFDRVDQIKVAETSIKKSVQTHVQKMNKQTSETE